MSVHYKLTKFDFQNIFYLVRWQDYLIVRSLVCLYCSYFSYVFCNKWFSYFALHRYNMIKYNSI